MPLSFGASLWLGMPSLRSCSVGPPPSAIHGRGRLTRHPCRVAHCAEPPLGLSRGRAPQKHREAAYRPTCLFKRTHSPVGASLLAKDVNDYACCLNERGVLTFFASRLAPTGTSECRELLILLWLWLWLWFLILICLPLSQRPSAGSAQWAPRQGCRGSRPRPWMADGGGPTEQCRSEGMPSLSEAPNGGAKRFASFWASAKGSRCKSETASRHHRSNGYVPHPVKPSDPSPQTHAADPQSTPRRPQARHATATPDSMNDPQHCRDPWYRQQ
ncbi:hypothetical protein PMI27_000543 [Pseudomonas sp. GM41(2012)]|nr:hypothetical protein PMI27_000543 [Pseudomonas sp. GM41(2012)]